MFVRAAVVTMFEEHLRAKNPGRPTVNYGFPELTQFIDSFYDVSALTFVSTTSALFMSPFCPLHMPSLTISPDSTSRRGCTSPTTSSGSSSSALSTSRGSFADSLPSLSCLPFIIHCRTLPHLPFFLFSFFFPCALICKSFLLLFAFSVFCFSLFFFLLFLLSSLFLFCLSDFFFTNITTPSLFLC